jgi:hypothetical protein
MSGEEVLAFRERMQGLRKKLNENNDERQVELQAAKRSLDMQRAPTNC